MRGLQHVCHSLSPRRQTAKERRSADEEVSAQPEEISAYTSVVFNHISVNAHQYSPLSMTHYSSTAAIDLLNQSGLSGDSQHPKYAPRSRCRISLLNHG